jgi:hypothetical protein
VREMSHSNTSSWRSVETTSSQLASIQVQSSDSKALDPQTVDLPTFRASLFVFPDTQLRAVIFHGSYRRALPCENY